MVKQEKHLLMDFAEIFVAHITVDYCWFIPYSSIYAVITRFGVISHVSGRL